MNVCVALVIQMQCVCAIMSSVVCTALQYFSTLFHKWHEFRNKATEHKMWVLISSITFVWDISRSMKNWARYDQKCILEFRESTRYSCLILMKLEFSQQFFEKKILKYQFSWKSVRWEQTDGRTDMTKLIVAFRNFANAPKIVSIYTHIYINSFTHNTSFYQFKLIKAGVASAWLDILYTSDLLTTTGSIILKK